MHAEWKRDVFSGSATLCHVSFRLGVRRANAIVSQAKCQCANETGGGGNDDGQDRIWLDIRE